MFERRKDTLVLTHGYWLPVVLKIVEKIICAVQEDWVFCLKLNFLKFRELLTGIFFNVLV